VALKAAADRNGGNRAAGTAGYDASAVYVADQLQAAGYRPQIQRFDATLRRVNCHLHLPALCAALQAEIAGAVTRACEDREVEAA